ncbi:MAG: hypothetical protein AAFQ67_03115 [Pseudomonadota bacterium]
MAAHDNLDRRIGPGRNAENGRGFYLLHGAVGCDRLKGVARLKSNIGLKSRKSVS